jgi:hypothetical protein
LAKQRWHTLLLEDVRLKLLHCYSASEMLQEICALPDDSKLKSISFFFGIGGMSEIEGIMGRIVKQLMNFSLLLIVMLMSGSFILKQTPA